jgi:hypothetical protein
MVSKPARAKIDLIEDEVYRASVIRFFKHVSVLTLSGTYIVRITLALHSAHVKFEAL